MKEPAEAFASTPFSFSGAMKVCLEMTFETFKMFGIEIDLSIFISREGLRFGSDEDLHNHGQKSPRVD